MPPGSFPTDSSIGQIHLYFEEMRPQAVVRQSAPFGDNGRDISIAASTKTRRFSIYWDGLTLVQAAILDAHLDAASYSDDEGSAYTFNFTLPTTGETVAGVRYAKGGYRTSHSKQWVQRREVLLERLP